MSCLVNAGGSSRRQGQQNDRYWGMPSKLLLFGHFCASCVHGWHDFRYETAAAGDLRQQLDAPCESSTGSLDRRAMVAVMCGVSLVAAAAVDADTPCKLWRFDGYTQFDFPDGGKMTFVTFGRLIDFDRKAEVVAIPPNGGAPTYSKIWGGLGFREAFADWELGNTIWMERFLSEGGPVSFSPGT